jgi:Na+/melibiose symporter-like transporter
MYVASFVATLLFGARFNARLGRRGAYLVGCAITMVGSALTFWTDTDVLPDARFEWLAAIVFGVGTSLVMVTGVSFVNDLVGPNLQTSAFVYGCMSFTDKLGSGLLIILIQGRRSIICDDDSDATDDSDECGEFVREVLSIVPAACCVVAALMLPWARD